MYKRRAGKVWTVLYCKVTEQIFGIIRLLEEEHKKPKDYGGGALLSHAEVLFLETIARNPDENVSALSERLGITKGAVTQMVGKLRQKELIETVKREDNKKEKYFCLTEKGETAILGHLSFHRQANQQLCDFIAALDEGEADAIFRFLECLRQCVPFCHFQCECKGEEKNNKEEGQDEPIAAECTRTACRA